MPLPQGLKTGCTFKEGAVQMQRRGGRATHTPGKMNKLEAAYAWDLELLVKAGKVRRWWFESIKFRLADRTYYTPDFFVEWADGVLEFTEVKGFLRDDAGIKFKLARELYPLFRFRMLQRQGGGWVEILK